MGWECAGFLDGMRGIAWMTGNWDTRFYIYLLLCRSVSYRTVVFSCMRNGEIMNALHDLCGMGTKLLRSARLLERTSSSGLVGSAYDGSLWYYIPQ